MSFSLVTMQKGTVHNLLLFTATKIHLEYTVHNLLLFAAMKIHLSNATYAELSKHQVYAMTHRGEIPIKGKGLMNTYWLDSKMN